MDQSTLDFLSQQSVEGELLADVLARGRLPGEKALRHAIEIGVVLSRAHARGLVHGSISPYSIAVTAEGARLLQPSLTEDPRSAPYYSPERVRGEALDERSDIFSFGAVLYELASGRQPFSGTGEELFQNILELPPPLFNGKTKFHLAMEGVIAGCLAKDPAARRQRIQNAVIELKLAAPRAKGAAAPRPKPIAAPPPQADTPSDAAKTGVAPIGIEALPERPKNQPWPPRTIVGPAIVEAPRKRMSLMLALGMIALVLVTVAGMAAAALSFLRPRSAAPVVSFRVAPPENTSSAGPPSISPDGRLLAFPAVGLEGQRMLWLRPLDALRATPIPGTEGAAAPFWSPDSKNIGFFANRFLRKVAVDGGSVATICPAEDPAGGGSWNADGTILFAPGLSGGLSRVRSSGGTPEEILKPNSTKSETAFLWPQFLPDNQHFIFFAATNSADATGVYAGSMKSPGYRLLFASETNAVFSPVAESRSQKHGYLLFVRGRTPMAQEFNAANLQLVEDAKSLGDDIGSLRSLSLAPISVSNNGILVYQTVGDATRQVVWMNRVGKPTAVVKEAGEWGPLRISPDGTRAASAKLGPDRHADLWLIDTSGNTLQFTDTLAHEGSPVWSPDGSRLVFFSSGKTEGSFDLYTKPVSGGKMELLFANEAAKYPTDWSHDGRYVLFTAVSPSVTADIWAVSTADHHAGPVLNTIYTEGYASLSPDGRWLAYQSDQSGEMEIYVQPFDGIGPGTRRSWRVSKEGGGGMPRWRSDAKELFYVTYSGKMMAVAVHPAGDS
ncbi:MAG TPA: protein kinase, partial [Bryobacteraceae bacterium]